MLTLLRSAAWVIMYDVCDPWKRSTSRREMRVRGKGIPGDPPGDLFLVVEVVLPEASTAKARQLYETMQRELAFNPRAAW